jgi:hypothetical protein
MGFCKVRFDFLQQGLGFSEDWYLATTDPDFGAQITATQSLAPKRALCLGAQGQMTGAVLSEIGSLRHTTPCPGINFPLNGSGLSPSAPIDVALILLKQNTNFTSSGKIFLRGIWSAIVGPGNVYTPTTPWTGAEGVFIGQLLAGHWGWLGRNPTAQIRVAIATQGATPGVALNANGQPVITVGGTPFTVSLPGAFPTVRISGVKGSASVNGQQVGQFQNTPATAPGTPCNQFVCNKRIPMFPYTGGGKLTFNAPMFNQLASIQADRIGERKAGIPLPRSRGRSPVRVLA